MFDGSYFRSEKNKSIMKIRAKLLDAARCWLNSHDYVEVHGPTLIPAVGDWPGSFEVKYFDKKAYLTQGLQPYANAFVASLGKIYTIAPTFRVDKAETKRHLTEYWRIEVAQQCDLDTIIGVQEELVAHICHSLSKEAREELRFLDRPVEYLTNVRAPFPRLTYDKVIEILQRDGLDIVWGQKLDWEMEEHLSRKFAQPFFITKFPISIERLFYKSHPDSPALSLSVDLLASEGYGEIGGGGQMLNEKGMLMKRLEEENIELGDQQWYINFVQYGSLLQSGFAIGLERLLQWICKLTDIKKAVAFPRTADNIHP